ncbi:choline/ethanolamine kinase-like isoform X2 [Lycorma delicatula]
MIGEQSDMLEMAVRICRGYLHGPWKKITSNDIIFKRISGGLSNYLFHVKLQKGNAEPNEVLLRFYGQTHGEHALESLITDSVIFTLLSERRLGPKLHGIFPGGRIEEYIPARPLKTIELSDPQLTLLIADKMAAIHSMNVPINKEPCWLWNTINRWLQTIDENSFTSKPVNSFEDRLSKYDLHCEAKWLRNHLLKIRSPVVFCHNDMQEGNILMREDENLQNLVLIDFEYCSYNYRAFDIANHFLEWTVDYTTPEHPNFTVNRQNYPSQEQQLAFINRYLSCLNVAPTVVNNEINSPEHVLLEVRHFCLASHFFWSLWGIVNAKTSQIPFGYWEFAAERMDSYFVLKSQIIGNETGVKRKAKDLD